jgi:dienelactone hydrolase
MQQRIRLALASAALAVVSFGCAGEQARESEEMSMAPDIQTREIEYRYGDTSLQGFIAWDDAVEGKRPGVLVVHEWWGHNDYARRRARELAELGYTALAVDMYGEGKVAEHPDDAGQFATEVMQNLPAARARFDAAHELLDAHPTTDPDQTAAIGYCFGGGVVLAMGRAGADLDAVVSFHGSLPGEAIEDPDAVKAKFLVLHGAADPFVTPEQVDAFRKSMDDAGVDYRFVAYEGAMHSFTSPEADANAEKFDLPLAYDAAADEQSWQAMQDFFAEVFGAPGESTGDAPEEGEG